MVEAEVGAGAGTEAEAEAGTSCGALANVSVVGGAAGLAGGGRATCAQLIPVRADDAGFSSDEDATGRAAGALRREKAAAVVVTGTLALTWEGAVAPAAPRATPRKPPRPARTAGAAAPRPRVARSAPRARRSPSGIVVATVAVVAVGRAGAAAACAAAASFFCVFFDFTDENCSAWPSLMRPTASSTSPPDSWSTNKRSSSDHVGKSSESMASCVGYLARRARTCSVSSSATVLRPRAAARRREADPRRGAASLDGVVIGCEIGRTRGARQSKLLRAVTAIAEATAPACGGPCLRSRDMLRHIGRVPCGQRPGFQTRKGHLGKCSAARSRPTRTNSRSRARGRSVVAPRGRAALAREQRP